MHEIFLYFMEVQRRPGALCLNDEKFGVLCGNYIYIVSIRNYLMIEQQIINDYAAVNDRLLPWDWFVSPYYNGLEFNKLNTFSVRLTNPYCKEEKEKIGKLVADLLLKGCLDFKFRSIVVFEGYRVTPNLCKFSHLFEAGLLELYRLNFIACLGIWVPLVEGIVRSMLGITFSHRVNRDDLKNLSANDPDEQPFLDVVVDRLLSFFSHYLYKSVNSTSDLGSHNLNRHFFSHAISNEPLYCRDNCLKLLNVFDALLAIDFIVDSHFKSIFDRQHERVKQRKKYYKRVLKQGLDDVNLFKLNLLEDHPHFDKDFYYGKLK